MKKHTLRTALLLVSAFAIYALLIVPLVQTITTPSEIILTPSEYLARADQTGDSLTGDDPDTAKYITVKALGFIPIKRVLVNILPFDTILVGGTPIGICGQIDGVLVTNDAANPELRKGDVIKTVNGIPVQTVAAFNDTTADLTQATLTIVRNHKVLVKPVTINHDLDLRDTTNGVGMLTFINPVNNTFSALGHQMADFETGTAVDLCGGVVQPVQTYGITKTQGHQTGVLQSLIDKHATPQGSITQGTNFGVTGCLTPESEILQSTTTTMPVATRYTVRPGKATLRTALDGKTVEEFSCEILKTRYQNHKSDKSMVIRITDPRLLAATGGIIHGMSGSPIIQDGHLVGALTHAITNDPSKGYAVYIDFVAI